MHAHTGIKRAVSLMIVVLLTLAAWPVTAMAEEQVVFESGFEGNEGGFTPMGGSIEVSKDAVATGASSLKIHGGTEDWHGTRLPAVAGGLKLDAAYKITAKIFSLNDKKIVMQMTMAKAAGGTDYRWLADTDVKGGVWTEVSSTLEISSAEYSGIDNLSFENKTSPYGDAFYVDDVKIVKLRDLEAPETEASKEQMPEIGFEDGTTQGFSGRDGSEKLTVSGDVAHTGSKSLKTEGRTIEWHGPSVNVEQYIAQGLEYQVTAWVHAGTPDSSNITLSSQIGQDSGAKYVNLDSKKVSVSDGWVKLSGKYRYSNTSEGYVTVYVESDVADAEFYIDDISLVEIEGGGIKADLTLPAIKDIYKDHFLIGNIFTSQDVTGMRFDMLNRHFNVVTAENAMKPESTMPSKGNPSYAAVDGMLDVFDDAGIKVAGHTLAWHQQSPAWLNTDGAGNPLTRAEAEENLKYFVNEIAGHYKGRVISWDVLNEAINDNPTDPSNWRASLRESPWYAAFDNGATGDQSGADYVEMLFREARKADPDALLYYNDYNLDNRNKAIATAYMVKELNDKYLAEGNTRLLIDGIGMQGHYNMGTSMEDVGASLRRFIDIGVEVSITELDVSVPGVSLEDGLTEEAEIKQGLKYAELFMLLKKYSGSVARVTFWGLDDGASWRSEQFPQMFNGDLSAKKAYYAVADPEGYWAEYEEYAVVTTQKGTAVYGTPVLDGQIDEIWQEAEELPISIMLQAWQTATGTARVLWDSDNLYALFDVADPDLDNTSLVIHEQDSVEVFVDEKNCKAREYKDCDGQYRVCYDGTESFGSSTNVEGFESAVSTNGAGYIVEVKIPFKTIKPEAGMIIGFDAQINDAKDGRRSGIAKWNDPTDNSYQDTTGWGLIELAAPADGQQIPAEEPTDEPAQPETTPEPAANQAPAWPFVLGGIAVLAACAAGALLYMKKRGNK